MSLSTWSARVTGKDITGEHPTQISAERFAWTHPGPLTIALLVACGAIGVLTLADARYPALLMFRLDVWGAQVNEEIAAGQWWRLVSYAFLHVSWRHLILNGYALFVVGSLVERSFGRARLLSIYVISAVAGGLASFVFTNATSVGASGAIFGLMGASALILWRGRMQVQPLISQRMLATLAGWAALSLIDGFMNSGVNNAAHVGGLVAGALVAALLPDGPIASAVATLCTIALGWTALMMQQSVSAGASTERHMERGAIALFGADTATFRTEMAAAGRYAPALIMLAETDAESGDRTTALALLDSAIRANCWGILCAHARRFRAALLVDMDRNEEALAALDHAGEHGQPANAPEARVLRAIALQRLGRNEQVIAMSDRLTDWSDSVKVRRMHFIRASAFAALGRHVDAGREYGAAALAPTDADAWLSAHYEFAIARDSTDAATALLHAAEAAQRAVDSSHGTGVPALRLLGAALRLQHRCADAESTTARVIALQPSTKQSADDAGSGPIALWTETPPGERGFAVRVQNRGAHRVRIATLLFPTCENIREVCDAPVDPCLDLLPGAVGELWVSPLDPSRGFSLQPELGSIERR